jgi:hypothetical protein
MKDTSNIAGTSENVAKTEPKKIVETPTEDALDVHAPFIFDLGKRKKKTCRRIKEGRGPVERRVRESVQYAADKLGEDAKGKVFVPVVVLFERRRTRRRMGWL